MYVGNRVISKVNDPDYRLKVGDTGVVVEFVDRPDINQSYIRVRWDKPDDRRGQQYTDLGWWIKKQPKLIDGREIIHVISNLEIFPNLPDTREYLDAITTLA